MCGAWRSGLSATGHVPAATSSISWRIDHIASQKRSISASTIGTLPERLAQPALRLIVLLRLAALLHRSHDREPLPPLALAVGDKSAQLRIPRGWLDGHALTRSDLDTEREYLDDVGIRFTVRAA